MKMGPAAMLRSLDMVERRQLRLRSRDSQPGVSHPALTASVSERPRRAQYGSSQWRFWCLRGDFLVEAAPMLATFAAVFVTLWTLWMLLLLSIWIPGESGGENRQS